MPCPVFHLYQKNFSPHETFPPPCESLLLEAVPGPAGLCMGKRRAHPRMRAAPCGDEIFRMLSFFGRQEYRQSYFIQNPASLPGRTAERGGRFEGTAGKLLPKKEKSGSQSRPDGSVRAAAGRRGVLQRRCPGQAPYRRTGRFSGRGFAPPFGGGKRTAAERRFGRALAG